MPKTRLLEDYLDEDKIIPNQRYCVFSYLLPGKDNELDAPLFKVRGCYKTTDECASKIKSLQSKDKYFHMYTIEVGKWGSLLDDDSIAKMDDVDVEYREEKMNTMMRQYKESKDKADVEFESRTNAMKQRAQFEGTPEGQEYLANLKEEPI